MKYVLIIQATRYQHKGFLPGENLRLYRRCEAVVVFVPVVECGVYYDQGCDNKKYFGGMGCKDKLLRKIATLS